jgi:UDP-glucose 4-epimerase
MRVTITGGAGFIGANLAAHLRGSTDPIDVVVLDDLSTGLRENLDGIDAELIEGSILDPGTLDRAFEGADSVVHLAARPSVPRSISDPIASHRANDIGTIEVLEALRRVSATGAPAPHLVVASSSSVYGSNPQLPKHEELDPRPVSPYAASKLATEAYSLAWAASYGLEVLAVRFFNVFGPLQLAGHAYAAVVPAFVDAALDGRPLPVHGDGTQSRDFTFVGSLCMLLEEAVRRRTAHPGPVNLAFGTRITLLEVIAAIEAELGETLEREHLPLRPGDVPHTQADTTRLRGLFPTVEPIAFEDGLRATIDWFRKIRG